MVFLEDVAVGDKARFGECHVDRDEVIAFASRYDPQPFHLSDEAAAATHFGRLSASGWHTASMTMAMIVAYYRETGFQSLGPAGVDELGLGCAGWADVAGGSPVFRGVPWAGKPGFWKRGARPAGPRWASSSAS